MIVTLQSKYLDRYLYIAQGKDDLFYSQVDSGPASEQPDAPVYINVPYPEIPKTLSRYLWMQNTGLLPAMDYVEPEHPAPDPPVYINVPYLKINNLPGAGNPRTTFDNINVANRLWKSKLTVKRMKSRFYPAISPGRTPSTIPY